MLASLVVPALMTTSLTTLARADAVGIHRSGPLCPRFPLLCCDANPHTRHLWVRDDYPTDIAGCVSFVRLKRLLALRGGFNPVALAGEFAKSASSFFFKPALDWYFSNSEPELPELVSELKRLIKSIAIKSVVGMTFVQLVTVTVSYCRLSKRLDERLDQQCELLAPLSDEAQERRLEGCPLPVILEDPEEAQERRLEGCSLPVIIEDPGDPKKLIVEVRVPKNLLGLGEKAFHLESPEEELGRKIRLAVGVDGVSKTWTLQLPLAKHLDPTIKSKLIWLYTSIDGASQCKFRRCRLEVI